MLGLFSEIRQAARSLAKSPGFVAAAALTLAIGIGATTAIFSLVDQVTLRKLPVPEPERLALLRWQGSWCCSNTGDAAWSYPWYKDLRDKNEVFEALIGRYSLPASFGYSGDSDRVELELVTGNYFGTLGLKPALGRLIGPDDDVIPDGHPVAVLSHEMWRDRFDYDRDVVGKEIRLNGRAFDVIGVAPEGFRGLRFDTPAALFAPTAMKKALSPGWLGFYDLQARRNRWMQVFGKLKPGVSVEDAEVAMAPLFASLVEYDLTTPEMTRDEYSREQFRKAKLQILPGAQGVSRARERARVPVWTLMGMVGLLLLIGCANVANLMIARAAGRRKEIAVRLALGAGRGQILKQLMTESLLLATLGGALAILVAVWATAFIVQTIPDSGVATQISTKPDYRILAFAAGLTLFTAFLFGLTPALQSFKIGVVKTLKDQAGAVAGGHAAVRKALVCAQVFLSLVLLIGAGLFWNTLRNLRDADPGFVTDSNLVFAVEPPSSGYDVERTRAFLSTLQRRLAALPGAKGAAYSLVRLLSGNEWDHDVDVKGYEKKTGENMNVHFNAVSPGFFSALDVPIQEGREFRESDVKGAPPVVIVNESFARHYYGDGSAVGRVIAFWGEDREIVGVIPDVRYEDMRDEIPRQVFSPYAQIDSTLEAHVLVRTEGDPMQLAGMVRQAVREMDANLPIYDMRAMDVQLETTLTLESAIATFGMAFGIVASLLSGIGLYGVLAFSMEKRTREIGVRMALGASRANIAGMAMREVARMFVIGAALALPASYALGKLVQAQLHGISPHDPVNMLLATAGLAAIAAAAGFVPARRAAKTEPMTALRFE
jgi:predicted permease